MARWVLISATQSGVLIFSFMYSWIFLKVSRICFGTQAVASTSCAVLSSEVVCVANATITSANIPDTNTGSWAILLLLTSVWMAWLYGNKVYAFATSGSV